MKAQEQSAAYIVQPVHDEWHEKPLRELVTKLVDGSHNPPPKQDAGLPMLSARNIENNGIVFDEYRLIAEDAFHAEHSRTRVTAGDVLLTIVGTIGRTTVVPESAQPFALQRSVAVLTPGPEILPKYLCYQLQSPSVQHYFEANARGTAQKGVYLKSLGQTPIRVVPLDQQKRIVAEIELQFSRLDEAVANLKRVKANLKRYKAAVLKAAVEGRLVETEAEIARHEGRDYETGEQLLQRILETRRSQWKGKGKYNEPAAPDTSELPELPAGWVWATVHQLADVQLGKMLDRQKHRAGKELPYLRNINVRWDSVDSLDMLTMFFKDSELDRYGLKAGDVLVCEGGEPGRAAVWDGRIAGMMYQKAIHRVRFFADYQQRLLVFLLEYFAKSGRLERWFTGSTIKHFTRESFLLLPLPVPPETEQFRIVAEVDRRLSRVSEVEAQVNANLKRAERLRHAVLQRAFT